MSAAGIGGAVGATECSYSDLVSDAVPLLSLVAVSLGATLLSAATSSAPEASATRLAATAAAPAAAPANTALTTDFALDIIPRELFAADFWLERFLLIA
jgi:hypothetical protein